MEGCAGQAGFRFLHGIPGALEIYRGSNDVVVEFCSGRGVGDHHGISSRWGWLSWYTVAIAGGGGVPGAALPLKSPRYGNLEPHSSLDVAAIAM